MVGDQKLGKADWGLGNDLLDDQLDDSLVVNTLTDIMFILVDTHDQLENGDTGQPFD